MKQTYTCTEIAHCDVYTGKLSRTEVRKATEKIIIDDMKSIGYYKVRDEDKHTVFKKDSKEKSVYYSGTQKDIGSHLIGLSNVNSDFVTIVLGVGDVDNRRSFTMSTRQAKEFLRANRGDDKTKTFFKAIEPVDYIKFEVFSHNRAERLSDTALNSGLIDSEKVRKIKRGIELARLYYEDKREKIIVKSIDQSGADLEIINKDGNIRDAVLCALKHNRRNLSKTFMRDHKAEIIIIASENGDMIPVINRPKYKPGIVNNSQKKDPEEYDTDRIKSLSIIDRSKGPEVILLSDDITTLSSNTKTRNLDEVARYYDSLIIDSTSEIDRLNEGIKDYELSVIINRVEKEWTFMEHNENIIQDLRATIAGHIDAQDKYVTKLRTQNYELYRKLTESTEIVDKLNTEITKLKAQMVIEKVVREWKLIKEEEIENRNKWVDNDIKRKNKEQQIEKTLKRAVKEYDSFTVIEQDRKEYSEFELVRTKHDRYLATIRNIKNNKHGKILYDRLVASGIHTIRYNSTLTGD